MIFKRIREKEIFRNAEDKMFTKTKRGTVQSWCLLGGECGKNGYNEE